MGLGWSLAIIALCPLAQPVAAAGEERATATRFDRTIELELEETDGLEPSVLVELAPGFAGTLHLWTRSALDLTLQVEVVGASSAPRRDDDSGGERTPYLELSIEPDDALLVRVTSQDSVGSLELHAVASPESETTRTAVPTYRDLAEEARRALEAGEPGEARDGMAEVVEGLRALPGAEHSELVADCLWSYGVVSLRSGDLPRARDAWSLVRAHRERTLPAEHFDLLAVRGNLANVLRELGDIAGARAIHETVLSGFERTLPDDHPNVLLAKENLGATLFQSGDLLGALALEDTVLATRQLTLRTDDPLVLRAQQNLALLLSALGDLTGARALEEAVVAARERTHPDDDPRLARARMNLAVTLKAMGEFADALALEEAVLAARERSLPADHPALLTARGNLASTLHELGDLASVLEIEEEVLEAAEQSLPPGHPDLLAARSNLAQTLHGLGELERAIALQESVAVTREHSVPANHPDLLAARETLMGMLEDAQELDAVRALVPAQVDGMRAHVLAALALAPREAQEVVQREAERLRTVLSLAYDVDTSQRTAAFELQETMRMVAGEAARALGRADDDETEALREEAQSVRQALNDVAFGGEGEELEAELTRLTQLRDQLEREASRRLAARGVAIEPVDVERLAQELGETTALVAFRRIDGWKGGNAHLLAHVLQGDGSLAWIDLGEVVALKELVTSWRSALGAPMRARGVGVTPAPPVDLLERSAGEALRERLLDPILAELRDGTRRLSVCADDLVHLVPLDALPYRDASVGDRWTVVSRVSLARRAPPGTRGEGLLALGHVDYAEASAAPASRADLPAHFSELPETRAEVEAIAARYEDAVAVEPVVLERAEATPAALFEHARGKRYLHLATHGWFAPETIPSALDSGGARERVHGMAPMLLCGIALAGANERRDAHGRRSGVLTAEELATLDLSACDLAVLSACETNVGLRRAGQGIQSLQAALYAAGARNSITSLWKVEDAATRRLFELFYSNLWTEERPEAEALWRAKRVLREEGHPVRDWGAWVLTGVLE